MLSYLIFIATLGGIYALLALSLNLVWGMTGLVNLGLTGFFAVGAYGSAITSHGGGSFIIGLIAAIAASVIAGLLVTFATLRLRDDYLAIVTLGFAEVVRLVALNERWLTNGSAGISDIRLPFRQELGADTANLVYLGVISGCVLVVWLMIRRLDQSAYGRTLKAVREDQELASFAGKPVLRFKFQAFGMGAAIAGLAGALYAHQESFISPDEFDSLTTIYIFLAVTAGGVGRPLSAMLGGYCVVVFLEATRFVGTVLPFLDSLQLASLRGILVGLALFLILRLRPQGLLPERIPLAERTR